MFTFERFGDRPALIEGDLRLTYRQLDHLVEERVAALGACRQLVAVEAVSSVPAVVTLLACLRGGHPVVPTPPGKPELLDRTADLVQASIVCRRSGDGLTTELRGEPGPLHPDLAMVLSTSGSTGVAKFVRLSHRNLATNAHAICSYLPIEAADRGTTTLPLSYSFGLSILTTHLLAGASLVLTDESVTGSRFWDTFIREGCTTFSGVPFTFEVLHQRGFSGAGLPNLRYVTQAGGRLAPDLVRWMAGLGQRNRFGFYVMYGQTEASPRMSYLPPHLAADRPDSIGVAIPGGRFRLIDEDGGTIDEPGVAGELVYQGPNVMMGYATEPAHLARGAELGELRTGDLARRDEHGLHYLVGRKSRFIKPFGLRVSLDEVEAHLRERGVSAVATGDDNRLLVLAHSGSEPGAVVTELSSWLSLPTAVIGVASADEVPTLPNGKIDYRGAAALVEAASPAGVSAGDGATSTAVELVRRSLGLPSIDPSMSYVDLGGDSLRYVALSMDLEELLGSLPPDWAERPIGELDQLDPGRGGANRVETAVLIRAVAILCVVASHFGLFSYGGGGTTALMAVAGLNFFRFQVPAASHAGSPASILRLAGRLVVPTVAFTVVVQALFFGFRLAPLLLISNYLAPTNGRGDSFWFIEVYVQLMVVLAGLLAIGPVRRFVAELRTPRILGLVAGGLVLRLAAPLVYPTDRLYDRVPHMFLVFFLIGWLLKGLRSTNERFIATPLVVAAAVTAEGVVFVLPVLLALLWLPSVRVPVPSLLRPLLGALAGGSLFIYLTHFQFRSLARSVLGESLPPLIGVILGVGGGILVWRCHEWTWKWLTAHLAGRRGLRPQGSATSERTGPAWLPGAVGSDGGR